MPALPVAIKEEMASRSHRMGHYLFHALRNSWEQLDQTVKDRIAREEPSWVPPRPTLDKDGVRIRDNNSGEDFLYMHREMIKHVNAMLAGNPAYPKVEGWKQLPEPDDQEFPVIPMSGYERVKSDDYLTNVLKPWENKYKSTSYLSSVTLGQLGSDIEFTIHNNMHLRWAVPSLVGYRPEAPITQAVDPRWDDVEYEFLVDTYSSHVGDTFWKIHGWVDYRIDDWKRANNVDEIHWIGTWIGPMHHTHMIDGEESLKKMFKVAADLGSTGFDGFLKFGKNELSFTK